MSDTAKTVPVDPDLTNWNDTFMKHMLKEVVLGLVQSEICCPYTGEILDIRKCHVLVDHEGDPMQAIDPAVVDRVREAGSFDRLKSEENRWIIARNSAGVWEVQS